MRFGTASFYSLVSSNTTGRSTCVHLLQHFTASTFFSAFAAPKANDKADAYEITPVMLSRQARLYPNVDMEGEMYTVDWIQIVRWEVKFTTVARIG